MEEKARKIASKQQNKLKVILNLAAANSYDEYGHLIDPDGDSITSSDVMKLINNAFCDSEKIPGEDVFIRALKKANIKPETIINKRMREALTNLTVDQEVSPDERAEQVLTEPNSVSTSLTPTLDRMSKGRKRNTLAQDGSKSATRSRANKTHGAKKNSFTGKSVEMNQFGRGVWLSASDSE